MTLLTQAVVVLALAISQTTAVDVTPEGAREGMGPAAFMWPADRVWSAATDNTAPCGSIASVVNRTDFPLQNGKVALVAQDESYDIELAISYLQDPRSNSDFKTIIDMNKFKELELGHTCVNVEDQADSVKSGTNATLQVKYIADWDKPENQTFYACADITFVELEKFQTAIPCFNATQPSEDENQGSDKSATDGSPSASSSLSASKGKSGLSGGAIAGIVIGCLAGVAAVALAGFFIYRRKQQRMRVLRQQHSSRGVKWDERDRDSASNGSVRLNNL